MISQFLNSKKFRYLCFAVYGSAVVVACLIEYFFFIAAVAIPWDPGDTRPPFWMYAVVAVIILSINATLFLGLIKRKYFKNDIASETTCYIFIIIGIIYSFLFIMFSLNETDFVKNSVLPVFPLSILVYLTRIIAMLSFQKT